MIFIAACSELLLRQRTRQSNPKKLYSSIHLSRCLCLCVACESGCVYMRVFMCMWEWVCVYESLYVYVRVGVCKWEWVFVCVCVCLCVCVCMKKVILSMFNGTLCARNDFHCKGGFYRTGPFKYFDIPQVVVGPSCNERELTILKKWENVFIAFPHLFHRYRGCWLTLLGQVPMLRSRVSWVRFSDAVMMI